MTTITTHESATTLQRIHISREIEGVQFLLTNDGTLNINEFSDTKGRVKGIDMSAADAFALYLFVTSPGVRELFEAAEVERQAAFTKRYDAGMAREQAWIAAGMPQGFVWPRVEADHE